MGRARPSKANAKTIRFACLDESSSKRMKDCEIEYFMRDRGMSLEEACAIVVLDPEDYAAPSRQSRITGYLPTPDEIEERAAECRARREADRGDDDDEDGWTPPEFFCSDLELRR